MGVDSNLDSTIHEFITSEYYLKFWKLMFLTGRKGKVRGGRIFTFPVFQGLT
jgi:hypothetical protein